MSKSSMVPVYKADGTWGECSMECTDREGLDEEMKALGFETTPTSFSACYYTCGGHGGNEFSVELWEKRSFEQRAVVPDYLVLLNTHSRIFQAFAETEVRALELVAVEGLELGSAANDNPSKVFRQ